MTYIWINPVVREMYEPESLNRFLAEKGFCPTECRTDWGQTVREKYQACIDASDRAVADVRCPAAAALLQSLPGHGGLKVPDIEPILLHCAREISGRPDLAGCRKLITTPCQALAEAGNLLGLPDTEFVAWNDFLNRLGAAIPGKALKKSPIPPGFFKDIKKSCSISGPETVRSRLKEGRWEGVNVVEMLYCSEGCHNGDGVTAG